ncbi:MAG: hypothetical protein WA405_12765 [Candidatus Acidiferrales bacterium]
MEAAHDFDRLDIDGVLLFKLVLFVSGDKCEVMDVLVEFGEREFDGGNTAEVE